MDFKKLLAVSTATLILSACGGGGGGGSSPVGSGVNSGGSGDKGGAGTGEVASNFDYFNKACPDAPEGSLVLSNTKCLNGEFVGTSQNTSKACTVKYAFKDGSPQTISQIVHIDDLNITLNSSKAPDKFKSIFAKSSFNGSMFLTLTSDYAMTGTDDKSHTAVTQLATGQYAESYQNNIEVVIAGVEGEANKKYRCNLTGFSSAN